MSGRKITVVIVDDHPIVREGMVAALEGDEQFRLLGQFEEGGEALKAIERLKPEVAVIDIAMPGMSGIELCHEIRRLVPRTAVLFMSMYGDARMIGRAMKRGGRGYFSKRAPTAHLADAIRVVAGGGLYLSPGISPKVLSSIATGEGDVYDRLTRRERQVLMLIADGRDIRSIATELKTAVRTINVHRYNLMKKLDIHSQSQLVKYAFERGLVLPGV